MSSEKAKRPRLSYGHLRADLVTPEAVNSIRSTWAEDGSLDDAILSSVDVKVVQYPFPVCVISNFIENEDLLKAVVKELDHVTFYQKNNDLYQFMQTDDVGNVRDWPNINKIYDVLCTEVHSWLGNIFEKDVLKQQLAATFSIYKHEDRLLCHDDKCEDRHIAFVLYLMEEWSEDDGGSLQLFNTDKNLYPKEVVHSIQPKFNTLVMFEVTPTSFHQVAEISSKTRKRISLNGWFHSEGKRINISNNPVLKLNEVHPNDVEYKLEDYFLFNYLEFKNQLDIKAMFISDSEIQLEEFLIPQFWQRVLSAFQSGAVVWTEVGPANIRKYDIALAESLPAPLQLLKSILESRCWFKYLKAITGLDFTASTTSDLDIWERGKQPSCNVEIQRWTHGCYTLIHDQDPEFHTKALDVLLRLPFANALEDNENADSEDLPEAGHVIYIDKDSKDDECLLHIGYKMNSLGLIFRDTKTLRFTKYLDSTAIPFYQISCTYRAWSPPEDDPDLKHCEEDSDSEPSDTSQGSDRDGLDDRGEEEIEENGGDVSS